MIRALLLAAAAVATPSMVSAADPPLQGPLAQLSFMVGDWRAVGGGSGPGAGGDSSFRPDLGGHALVRRDHVLLKSGGGFDILMVVYGENGGLGAEFLDTEGHVIHYRGAAGAGPSAVFEAAGSASSPGYRLTYAAVGPDRLHIRFEIAAPGGALRTYSEGDVARR